MRLCSTQAWEFDLVMSKNQVSVKSLKKAIWSWLNPKGRLIVRWFYYIEESHPLLSGFQVFQSSKTVSKSDPAGHFECNSQDLVLGDNIISIQVATDPAQPTNDTFLTPEMNEIE